ncbi:Mog1p/PsbP-like protein [Dacryopinax primogenitus]|uniref:Mog1p/PsbP-like protein n=1 Tax=Dacryopinax primogenitus (strain DJM 731) TaxID=1858805 RepID=M5GEL9_DACPD|nr:Mog1p/PsbP-like protein [Dacryopinax primogenitus]EJU05527.1 Mog1p/PsbP-like protein [Dacryopinax primogenitus]
MRELFGGAITVNLPDELIDASDFRQIPDTQEVFLDKESDVSFVIEILELVNTPSFGDAATFHFDSLAHDNDAEGKRIDEVVPPVDLSPPPCPPNQPVPTLLTGRQFVRKFNRPEPDEVRIVLALFRIPAKNADVVMSMNFPVKLEATGPVPDVERKWEFWRIVFMTAVQSFQIVDFGLFAGGSQTMHS